MVSVVAVFQAGEDAAADVGEEDESGEEEEGIDVVSKSIACAGAWRFLGLSWLGWFGRVRCLLSGCW